MVSEHEFVNDRVTHPRERGERSCGSQRALTQKQTLGGRFESPSRAYLSDCNVELPLRPSASAAPPSGPRLLPTRLRGWGPEAGGELCQRALTQKRTLCDRFEVVAYLSVTSELLTATT